MNRCGECNEPVIGVMVLADGLANEFIPCKHSVEVGYYDDGQPNLTLVEGGGSDDAK